MVSEMVSQMISDTGNAAELYADLCRGSPTHHVFSIGRQSGIGLKKDH